MIYKLPKSDAYVFAVRPFADGGWYLHGDDLRDEASFKVGKDCMAEAFAYSGPPQEPFDVEQLRKVPDCDPIRTHVCGEYAFPNHAEVCPGPTVP